MSLRIVGPVEPRKQYDRVPMHDGIGPVTAYVKPSHVDYAPKGGSEESRETRAALIAAEVGGEVAVRHEATWVAVQRF